MITCKLGDNIINCYDGSHDRDQLKKWANKNILICPACEKTYEYCHGKIKSPYFRHKNKNECEDKYSESETEEHIKGKSNLFEWIKVQNGVTDAILEGWLPKTKQRPDIMFKYNDKQYVIEYQCSPISSEYIERHELYKAAGINDIWILGTNKYFEYYHKGNGEKRINELEKHIGIYYDSLNNCIYKIHNDISEKNARLIVNEKSYVNLMNSPLDYKHKKENFHLVKGFSKSFVTKSYYPSGRSSRKYPYPITYHEFDKNLSLAKCNKLNDVNISYLGGVTYR